MEQFERFEPFKWTDIEQTAGLHSEVNAYQSNLFTPIDLDLTTIELENPYAPTNGLEKDLQLPDLESFSFGPLEDVESLDSSRFSPEPENSALTEYEDIWEVALDLGPVNKDIKYYSWEAFHHPQHEEPISAYVSEAGPSIFDALQAGHSPFRARAGRPVETNIILRSLYEAGLGRPSILFTFNDETNSFEPTIQDSRVPGCSLRLSQSVVEHFITCGTLFRRLKRLSHHFIAHGSRIPVKVALAKAVSSVLLVVEENLTASVPQLQSLLQLQSIFTRPKLILELLHETIKSVENSKTSEEVLSQVFHKAEQVVTTDSWLSDCILEIFRLTCDPWLSSIERWVGLKPELPINHSNASTLPSFVGTDDRQIMENGSNHQTNHVFKKDQGPDFVPPEDAKAIFETGLAFHILQRQHSAHPLCTRRNRFVSSLRFDWAFRLDSMQRLVDSANAYEAELKATIGNFNLGSNSDTVVRDNESVCEPTGSHTWLSSDAQVHWLRESVTTLDAPPSIQYEASLNTLREAICSVLTTDSQHREFPEATTQIIPLALAPTLSLRPLLHVHAHIVHATTLRLLFQSHHLRSHLCVLHAYHLLGNGTFLVRLTNALFSPELASAERRRGAPRIGQTMGLQLGNRSTWPPASSELRLVLMGILSESYGSLEMTDSNAMAGPHEVRDRDLPGGLSFAVRQLSEEEIEKCIQPDSLHALDFLRLQYTPPEPLNAIITSLSLQRYDAIFKLLLRVVRVRWIIDQQRSPLTAEVPLTYTDTSRQALNNLITRFQFEAKHFAVSIASHFFTIGISTPWRQFNTYCLELERRLTDADYLDHIKTLGASISAVREAHEMMLGKMMTALFLRKRQARVMRALEEVFDAILKLTGCLRDERQSQEADLVRELYVNFRRAIRDFLSACRRTGEKEVGKAKLPGPSTASKESNDAVEMLLVQLCMNGYYDKLPP
ncbi:hypothetical protein EV356DRAFT_452704 [Viridothelium virens]|uniref:Spindle pole body component n=1 Tax=Viridothelium virens TaxID=1048519 RepID=A0A6A6GZQ6_VIRVR|nr:hypothetical protein EV356DRAFT_452704 [Viridothelium virens]